MDRDARRRRPLPSLILVRHGQASFGADDYDQLSDRGYRQARITADALAARRVSPRRLVTGSLLRQRQTAEPIAEQTGLAPDTDARWDEYSAADLLTAHSASDARLEGQTAGTLSSQAFQAILDDGLRAWAAAGHASTALESWPQFRTRVDEALLETVTALGSGESAIVVSSAGTIAAACTTLIGGSVDTFIALNRVAVNAAVTTITSGASGQAVLSFNDHAHFQRLGRELITFR